MAPNIVKVRDWLVRTYKPSQLRDQLQGWVDANPTAITAASIAAGLLGVMSSWSEAERARFSRHYLGLAFDVRPIRGEAGERVKATIRNLPGFSSFMDNEGGLEIWHVAFAAARKRRSSSVAKKNK